MARSIFRGSQELYFHTEEEVIQFCDHTAALEFLRECAADPVALEALRDVLGDLSGTTIFERLDDDELLDHLAALLVSGTVRVARAPGVAFGTSAPEEAFLGEDDEYEESIDEKGLPVRRRKRHDRSWIEIQLVDEKNNPVEGERYEITLPGGGMRSGSTDREGLARHILDERGMCKICFPDLDRMVWEKISST